MAAAGYASRGSGGENLLRHADLIRHPADARPRGVKSLPKDSGWLDPGSSPG